MNLLSYLKKRQNQFWRNYGYHHGWTKLHNLPEVFAIESTNYCNLRCVMCPRGEPDIMERSLGSMSDDLFAKILDDVDFYKEPCWFHWFGEPLMNPNLFHQIDMAKRRGVPDLGISTNATLLDAKNAQAILDSGLDTILIAVDGASKDVYEKVRLSPTFTFERVCENVRGFLDLKRSLGRTSPKATLSIIVMEETKSQLEDFRRTWLAAGADEILFKPFVTWGNQDTQFVEIASLESRTAHSQRVREHPCFALWESVVIAWDGRVVPCCYDFDASVTLGDLKRAPYAKFGTAKRTSNFDRRSFGAVTIRHCAATAIKHPDLRKTHYGRFPKWAHAKMQRRKEDLENACAEVASAGR